jgi:hypothetical protein
MSPCGLVREVLAEALGQSMPSQVDPVLSDGGSHAGHVAARVVSSAGLSTLSRNVHRRTALLREAKVEATRPHVAMLEALASDMRRYLELATRGLANLQPSGRCAVRTR